MSIEAGVEPGSSTRRAEHNPGLHADTSSHSPAVAPALKDRGGGRVLGWDMLRGLCALTVACYHLLYWLEIAELPALGTYGVYLFFVLSGASLAYNYDAARLATVRDAGKFLFARWMRLAPLYMLLCVVWVLMLSARNAEWVSLLPRRLALNATFAFGVWDPATWALLVGGWSLGIEFVYYLLFPFIARVQRSRVLSAVLFTGVAAVQWYWIESTVGERGWSDAVVAYHQVPGFFAYFVGGCIIGRSRKLAGQGRALPFAAGVAASAAMAVLLALLMPQNAGDELLGARGAVLFAACFALVIVSGKVRVEGRMRGLAAWLGDATYGCYLLHPIVLWGIVWFALPGAAEMPLAARIALLAAVVGMTCLLATFSERYFERPLRARAASARRKLPPAGT